ncbi:MAG: cell division protein SepF [Candidatus Bathyarchaeota archaeon]|nr:cell division protein SepF [Candidatus Bathyarchaeota archaeon]
MKETVERFVSDINNEKEEEKERKPTKPNGVYLKAMPLRRLEDVETIKREIEAGNILILKVSPLAKKSVADVKQAVSDLYEFAKSIDADIARLGEERVVITPPSIRIWRQKKSSEEEDLPTAA